MFMSKQILARTKFSATLLNALITDDYQILNGLIAPFSKQTLQRSCTGTIDKKYMILSISEYLTLTISPVILCQRLYAYLANIGALNTFNTEK